MTSSHANADQLRRGPDDHPGQVVRIGSRLLVEAVARLVGGGSSADLAHARRFIDFAAANAIPLDALWSRLDKSGRIESSVLAVPSPGRTAMVFATHPAARPRMASIAGLIDHACRELAAIEIDLAQVLLEPRHAVDRETFLAGGFTELARLSYLERPLTQGPDCPSPRWPAGVEVEPYVEDRRDELIAVLTESYDGTLDCPGLRGLRRPEDILEGHRSTGQFDPALWTLLRLDGRTGGTLLLNPSPGHDTVELVYLGLAPWARGRGLGRQLLRHGLTLLAQRRERTITLAVDESNAPALAIYRSEGFRRVLRRLALIRGLVQS